MFPLGVNSHQQRNMSIRVVLLRWCAHLHPRLNPSDNIVKIFCDSNRQRLHLLDLNLLIEHSNKAGEGSTSLRCKEKDLDLYVSKVIHKEVEPRKHKGRKSVVKTFKE